MSSERLRHAVVYVGSGGPNDRATNAIYTFDFDLATGALTPRHAPIPAGTDPSYMALDPTNAFLYVVNEGAAAVAAFAIDPKSGALTFVNRVPSGGEGPTHVSLDNGAKFVLVANYNAGIVTTIARNTDGSLGRPRSARAFGANAATHCIKTDPTNGFAFVANKDTDQIAILAFDGATGALGEVSPTSVKTPTGAGPRHIDFHPNGRFAYCVDELANTMTAYAYDAREGALFQRQALTTLPAGFTGTNTAAEVQIAPSGKFVYASNRGDDSIAAYEIDATTGALSLVGHTKTGGRTPRHFQLEPHGGFLIAANQDSDTLAVFRIDQDCGSLLTVGGLTHVPSPAYAGVVYLPEG